eukprot:2221925-Pyramimonas_sp.AAC.1
MPVQLVRQGVVRVGAVQSGTREAALVSKERLVELLDALLAAEQSLEESGLRLVGVPRPRAVRLRPTVPAVRDEVKIPHHDAEYTV